MAADGIFIGTGFTQKSITQSASLENENAQQTEPSANLLCMLVDMRATGWQAVSLATKSTALADVLKVAQFYSNAFMAASPSNRLLFRCFGHSNW